jgi:uncharacterized protein (TIGR04255 family)
VHGSLLNIPHHERRRFRKHFVNSVHCELTFEVGVAVDIGSIKTDLAKPLENLGFRYSGDLHQGGIMLMATGPIPQVSQTSSVSGATFWTENPRRQLNIMQNSMTLSDSGYVSFEEFLKQLKLAAAIVAAKLDSRVVRKVGLRKINSIRIDSVQDLGEAVAVFNPVLFSAARSGAVVMESLKSTQEVIAMERDKDTCVLRSALLSTGMPGTFDAHLDFDLIDQSSRQLDEVFADRLPEMNRSLFDVFMWSVTPSFLEILET